MAVEDEEIDLRPYIITLIRHWRIILLVAALAGGAGLALNWQRAKSYDATTTMLLIRSRASLSLAQQYPTVNEPLDLGSRITAYAAIINSDGVMQETIDELGDKLPASYKKLEDFKKLGAVYNRGDLLMLTVTTKDSKLSTEVANTWAQHGIAAINQAYSGEQPASAIQAQLQSVQQSYEGAQKNLEAFVKDNQIQILQGQVQEARTLFDNLSSERAWQIEYYAQRKQAMDQIVVQAQALKQQLQAGSASKVAGVGDAIAVLKARASGFEVSSTPGSLALGSNPGAALTSPPNSNPSAAGSPAQGGTSAGANPSSTSAPAVGGTAASSPAAGSPAAGSLNVNVQLADLSALAGSSGDYAKDLDQLIQLAGSEKDKADKSLQTLAQEVIQNPQQALLDQTAAQIGTRSAQLEGEQARLRDLTSQRDVAWQAYQAMAQKQTEIKSTAPSNAQVNLASLAVPSEKPATKSALRSGVIYAAAGFALAVLFFILFEWWRTSLRPYLATAAAPNQAGK